MTLKQTAVVLFSTFLVGCAVGPKYVRPTLPAAPAFTEGSSNWKAAQPADQTLRGDWWQLFGDAKLSELATQVAAANQSLKVAEAHFREAQIAIRYNRSFLYPTVGTGPSITHNRISSNAKTGIPGAEYGNFSLPLSVSYEPDLWGRIRKTVEQAKDQYQAAGADLENAKLELQAELAANYFAIRTLDTHKRILNDTIAAYQKALDLTTNRFQGGVASKAEVAQAQTQLDQTQAQAIDLDVARAQFEHAIAVLTGQVPENFHVPVLPLAGGPPFIPTGVPAQLLERRPDIARAERDMAAANEQIGIARTAFFPDLLISATGGFQAGSIVDWFAWPSRFWAVGPQVLQTVFDAGRRRSQVETAQAAYDATVANYRETSLTAFREVEDQLAALRILEQEAAKQHEAAVSAENSLQLAINRYKGGLVTYLEVVTAQSISLANERAEADVRGRRMDASIQLIKALGGGWDVTKLPKS